MRKSLLIQTAILSLIIIIVFFSYRIFLYEEHNEEKKVLSDKVLDYVASEFSIDKTIDDWHSTMLQLVEDWQSGKRVVNRFEIREL